MVCPLGGSRVVPAWGRGEYRVNSQYLLHMRPYRASARSPLAAPSLLLCSLVVVLLNAFGVNAAEAPAPNIPPSRIGLANDPLTRSGFEHYYSLEYEKALVDFEKVR